MKIIAVGDTILSNDFFYANSYKYFSEYFNSADILTLNLETVVSDENLKEEDKAVCFKTAESNLENFIKKLNNKFVFNIANNHLFDYGKAGYESTKRVLKKYNVPFIGEKNYIYVMEMYGKKIAFIGAYESEINELNSINSEFIDLIERTSANVDFCIVHVHWGRELSIGISEFQLNWAHKIIDAGCNIIIGHHPHVLQGIEKYKEGYIFYSLGNFQIPINPYEKLSMLSVAIEININNQGIISYTFVPIVLNNCGIPILGNKHDYEIVSRLIKEASGEIQKYNKIRYYLNISHMYIKESIRAWKIRIKKREKHVYKSIFIWICSGMAVKTFAFMVIDKLIGYSSKRNKRIWNGIEK